MTVRGSQSRSGIALIMVMMVVTMLAALAAGFAISMKVETKLARNASMDTDLEWLARGGIETAKYVLSLSNPAVTHLGQAWAGGSLETNEVVQSLVGPEVPLGNGSFRLTIEDLDRKLNINNADEEILRQALIVVGVDASVGTSIANSILDWVDTDDDAHPNGAEKDFYLRSDPPYIAKNGWIDDVTELLLINGIREDPGIFWGSGAPPSHRQPKSARASHFEQQTYDRGLRDLFSGLPYRPGTRSGGTLNLNTASPLAMQVFRTIDERVADEIVQARRRGPLGVDGETPLTLNTPILGGTLGQLFPGPYSQKIDFKSYTFEVKIEAKAGGVQRTYVAHLRRVGGSNQFQVASLIWLN